MGDPFWPLRGLVGGLLDCSLDVVPDSVLDSLPITPLPFLYFLDCLLGILIDYQTISR